jgi:hypothetical protein
VVTTPALFAHGQMYAGRIDSATLDALALGKAAAP